MKSDSKFIQNYKDRMTKIMLKTNPGWDKKDIEKVIMDMIKEQAMNPRVQLDNNFTGENRDTTLMSVFDWALERKPLIAGNGTFYKNQYEALNPISQMLENMAASRKSYKKEMFKVGEIYGFESAEYKDLDRKQANEKINMNSYYGASGAPSSAFYSKWSGAATTLTAQSVISTAETLFEAFLADNYIYLNMTELMEWILAVIKEDIELDDFVRPRTRSEVCERLIDKILQREPNDEEILYNFLLSLDDSQITLLYYKNNMIEFFKDHDEIKDIMNLIFASVENMNYVDTKDEDWLQQVPDEFRYEFMSKTPKDWNKFVDKQYFMDPNDPPKVISNSLAQLSEYLMKYCYVRFMSIDRIYRLRNFKRRVVTVIDTDSNFLSLDTLIEYIMYEVKDGDFGRDFEHNSFIAVNTITYTITNVIEDMLLFYGKYSNIPEEFRPMFNMKNEFFNSLLVIGKAKKRYISKQVLREGNLISPPKVDIKGFDFKKSTTSEYAEEVFMKMIKKHIIDSENIQLKEMIKELRDFKNEIVDSIKRGERTFLPNGSAKEAGAYADPGSEQSYRGVLTWNLLNPDNMIDFPSRVSLVKMNIFVEDDIKDLEQTNPDIYNVLINEIFNDETGIFVVKTWNPGIEYVNPKNKDWVNNIPKKYRAKYKKLGPVAWNEFVDEVLSGTSTKYKITQSDKDGSWEYRKRGVQVLAVPSNATIPEWAQPYIDYDTMANNIIAPFKPVLEIFGPQFIEEGQSRNGVNRKTTTVSNIIKF